jgi:hypothetical protein
LKTLNEGLSLRSCRPTGDKSLFSDSRVFRQTIRTATASQLAEKLSLFVCRVLVIPATTLHVVLTDAETLVKIVCPMAFESSLGMNVMTAYNAILPDVNPGPRKTVWGINPTQQVTIDDFP